MKIGIYLDLSDLYHRVNRKFSRKLNYEAVIEKIKALYLGDHTFRAYGIQRGSEAAGFIACLERLSIETRFKRPEIVKCGEREVKRANWDCGITVDILKDACDIVILGSGNNSLTDLARFRPLILLSASPGHEIRNACTNFLEITEDLLE